MASGNAAVRADNLNDFENQFDVTPVRVTARLGSEGHGSRVS